eukprot:3368485-Lingulodinium_polyedra.AAC.1
MLGLRVCLYYLVHHERFCDGAAAKECGHERKTYCCVRPARRVARIIFYMQFITESSSMGRRSAALWGVLD